MSVSISVHTSFILTFLLFFLASITVSFPCFLHHWFSSCSLQQLNRWLLIFHTQYSAEKDTIHVKLKCTWVYKNLQKAQSSAKRYQEIFTKLPLLIFLFSRELGRSLKRRAVFRRTKDQAKFIDFIVRVVSGLHSK